MKYLLSVILLSSLLLGQEGHYQLKKLVIPHYDMFFNKDNRTFSPLDATVDSYDVQYYILFDTYTSRMYRLSEQTYYDNDKNPLGFWYMKNEMLFIDQTDVEFQKALDEADNKNK